MVNFTKWVGRIAICISSIMISISNANASVSSVSASRPSYTNWQAFTYTTNFLLYNEPGQLVAMTVDPRLLAQNPSADDNSNPYTVVFTNGNNYIAVPYAGNYIITATLNYYQNQGGQVTIYSNLYRESASLPPPHGLGFILGTTTILNKGNGTTATVVLISPITSFDANDEVQLIISSGTNSSSNGDEAYFLTGGSITVMAVVP